MRDTVKIDMLCISHLNKQMQARIWRYASDGTVITRTEGIFKDITNKTHGAHLFNLLKSGLLHAG